MPRLDGRRGFVQSHEYEGSGQGRQGRQDDSYQAIFQLPPSLSFSWFPRPSRIVATTSLPWMIIPWGPVLTDQSGGDSLGEIGHHNLTERSTISICCSRLNAIAPGMSVVLWQNAGMQRFDFAGERKAVPVSIASPAASSPSGCSNYRGCPALHCPAMDPSPCSSQGERSITTSRDRSASRRSHHSMKRTHQERAVRIRPLHPQEVKVLPDWTIRTGVGLVPRSATSEGAHAVAQRFDIQLARLEGVIERCRNFLRHLVQVEVPTLRPRSSTSLTALLGDEERAATEVLVRTQTDVPSPEASDEPRIGVLVGRCVFNAEGAAHGKQAYRTSSMVAVFASRSETART